MSLTEDQAREMEKQLVLRILGDACTEYTHAAEELERRKEFRTYVMRRAESSGFTLDEIAAATELTWADVEGLLHGGGEDGGNGGNGGAGDARNAAGERGTGDLGDTGTGDLAPIIFATEDTSESASGIGGRDAIGGDEDLLVDESETVLEVASPFEVLGVPSVQPVDPLTFDDIAETIGHLNLQIGDDTDEREAAVVEASGSAMGRADAPRGATEREAEDQRIRSAWSWSRR